MLLLQDHPATKTRSAHNTYTHIQTHIESETARNIYVEKHEYENEAGINDQPQSPEAQKKGNNKELISPSFLATFSRCRFNNFIPKDRDLDELRCDDEDEDDGLATLPSLTDGMINQSIN